MRKAFAAVLTCIWILALSGCGAVRLNANAAGTVTYRNECTGVSFSEKMTAQEVETVAGILNGKKQKFAFFNGIPTCGFSSDFSVTIDGVTFALAQDKCGVLQNCNTLQYVHISDAEREAIEAIFTSRGGTFPCI